MLSILAPKTEPSGRRTYGDLHHVLRPADVPASADAQKQTRSYSMGSNVARNWEAMNSKPSPARVSASASRALAQPTKYNSLTDNSRTPARSLSVSNSEPTRPTSIASSKVAAPTCSEHWKPQTSDVPHLVRTPWEVERYKRNSTWRRSGPDAGFPARIFKNLPREVYECIVLQLEQIHIHQDVACPSCYLRDLSSLSLTSRAWDRAAAQHMYRRVYVIGHEDHSKPLRPAVKGPSRLKLLRRTLRERHMLARQVLELHLPDFQMLYQKASIEREEIVNLVASLVMACPSLERLVGFHIPFTHTFDRLSYALATRSKLRERVWILSESEDYYSDGEDDDETNNYYVAARDPTERFLALNAEHPLLTTLVLHRSSGDFSPTLNFRAIIGTFRQLPMLQNLFISGLSATSFTNLALNALPPRLRSLRLENLPGINDKGLQKFATSHLPTSIEKLMLINLELSSLITVTNILSEHFSELKHFTIAQYRTPDLGPRISIPKFSSPSLKSIHFEFRSQSGPVIDPFSTESRKSMDFPFSNPEPISCLATSLLAINIKQGAFPALRRVRVPHDPQGLIQALCKPRATALIPSDTSLYARSPQKSGTHGYAILVDAHTSQHQPPNIRESSYIVPLSPRADSAIDSPTFDTSSSSLALTPSKSRFAAQARILAARKAPFMTVRVHDPDGEVCIDTTLGGFIGDIQSNIVYDLKPDESRWPGNRDQSGPPQPEWITGIEDLLDERTPPNDRLAGRYWGDCGHRIGGRVGRNTVRVEELV